MPYFGKNQIRYDNFKWMTYETDHFIIYFYPEIQPHLERMAGYAESAYQHISTELKYDLGPEKVALILFQTSSEFQQQNVIPGAAQEGVGAFAEPTRKRILMPMDEPPDLLYRLIVHELTHQFEFDIIPTSLMRRNVPLWVNEGLSDYMTGIWRPLDLMSVRDAAVTDIVPKMSKLDEYGGFSSPRMIYNLGHAVFEFMEVKWGKEGLRQYLFALRKSVIGGGENAYQEAFKIEPEDFDQQFEKYLKDRFKPFRDKERPSDYGRNLAPNPEKSSFSNALSAEPSPSGDLIAVVTGNRKDQEADIVLVSGKDGSVIRNLTKGFDQSNGYEFLITPGGRWNTVPWMSWAPSGDRLGYFVRTEKSRTLILQNVVTRKIEDRFDMRTLDEPESPDISPDGRRVVFAALEGGVGDIFMLDLQTRMITNLTKDAFGDAGPTWSPDGKFIVYVARVSGNEKLFRLDIDTGKKTQITFGTHDDSSAQFVDQDTLIFSSTATNPSQPIDPDVARNGADLQHLDAQPEERRAAAVHRRDERQHHARSCCARGNEPAADGVHRLLQGRLRAARARAPRSDHHRRLVRLRRAGPGHRLPGAALAHAAHRQDQEEGQVREDVPRRPPAGERRRDERRRHLRRHGGDLQRRARRPAVQHVSRRRSRSTARCRSTYLNLERRLNYALQGFSQTQFFYGQLGGVFYDPIYSGFIDRDLATATTHHPRRHRLRHLAVQPLPARRVLGRLHPVRPAVQRPEPAGDLAGLPAGAVRHAAPAVGLLRAARRRPTCRRPPSSASSARCRATPCACATRWRRRSATRSTARPSTSTCASISASAARACWRCAPAASKSWGDAPDFLYFGGNSEMRGYEYLQFVGSKSAFLNAELRFPLIEAMLTPLGVMGGIRGVFFANMGGGHFEGQQSVTSTPTSRIRWLRTEASSTRRSSATARRLCVTQEPIYGPPRGRDGLRLVDARASYGVGLETFALGFPVHIDWSWKTLFNKDWEDALFAAFGGSEEFRKPKVTFWIGYDF